MATRRGSRTYVPERGDIVAVTFDPVAGHEQAGRRPAIVLSPASYNARSGLAVCAPVTTQIKDYPFEVTIPAGFAVHGAVLADQFKSVDWRARNVRFISKLTEQTLREVLRKATLLIAPAG